MVTHNKLELPYTQEINKGLYKIRECHKHGLKFQPFISESLGDYIKVFPIEADYICN